MTEITSTNKFLIHTNSKYYALSETIIKQHLSNSFLSEGRNAEFAFDGNIDTFWASKELSGHAGVSWIGVELSKKTTVEKIKIYQGGSESSNSIYYLPDVKLQGSNDGVTWRDIQNLFLRERIMEEIVINAHEEYRFFRILANSNTPTSTDSAWIVNELEFIVNENQTMSVINSNIYDSIVKYGMDESNLKISSIDEIRKIEKKPLMLGNGKIYEHTIDLNKNKVNIITFH
ncbi:discoidin domain-containing protein [Paenibacillus sp. J2TS4]|uniref:discoidin domain-containing protein n=1 Tax=Paenibacillus sp. J2TS4 TaxID=2807194 RepID=UPI001B12D36B|nr:discoidin domain-containing protein [Paenibacillus sp. J2TS4]GIP32591.1 hypothetical protein J2TS4_18010 [Paenibacillus sp. J2TS4]